MRLNDIEKPLQIEAAAIKKEESHASDNLTLVVVKSSVSQKINSKIGTMRTMNV